MGLSEDDAGVLILSALVCDIGEMYLQPRSIWTTADNYGQRNGSMY